MSYLEHESIYRELVSQYLRKTISVGEFIPQYFAQWKTDRDAQWSRVKAGQSVTPEESALSTTLDAIFTACEAFDPSPQTEYEIDEEQLTKEISGSRPQTVDSLVTAAVSGIPRYPRRGHSILSTLVISHELESALQEQCVSLLRKLPASSEGY